MNPAADVLALSTIEVDLANFPRPAITAVWRGKPLFVRHRTAEEIQEAAEAAAGRPARSAARPGPDQKPEWLVLVGICTHLGCVPLGKKPTERAATLAAGSAPATARTTTLPAGSGKGPAPVNLAVPAYAFLTDTAIRIG